ncbi:MAG: phenylalanine--tRNA ligase subunit beta [Oscillospiraceae bacterium]|nr:phenylalanine--tRNA ligase subunit beta [Oscillospiraceae bacterium]
MNLSLNWLNEYVDVTEVLMPDFVAKLTMSGTKVEKTKKLSEPLSKIVIGKVTEIKKHENSDKLWVCQINVGEQSVQIVTGAQNVTEGAIVPVVLDGGTVLRDGNGFKIKKGKLRGEVSEGMLCGFDELGLSLADVPYAMEDGILLLSDDPNADKLTIGGCALEFLGLNDTVIEFEITNNRPDCFSVTGLAREVAATFDSPLNIPAPNCKGVEIDDSDNLTVTVQNTELCSRYMAAVVKNVKIAPSPRWLTSRLKAHGIRPINNIVDITNYVMLEHGNPLHAFDRRFINDGKSSEIIVRNANDGEQIALLDGNTATLDSSMLVIADSSKPLAVAGVMGGEHSGVVDDTTDVIFEAACFDKVSVRLAAKKIGRRTESSSRFEKGLNPVNTKKSLLRALELVEQLGIGEVSSPNCLVDCVNFVEEIIKVSHNYEEVNNLLGSSISREEQLGIFARLGLGYDESTSEVIVPSWRSDIKLPCDLAEEVARIYGYNNIPSVLPAFGKSVTSVLQSERGISRLANALITKSCYECVTYSFVSPKMNSIAIEKQPVSIRNPFGEETSVMRTSLIPSMLKVISDNINVGNLESRLFEIGRIYSPNSETDMLCVAVYGKNEDFYSLKEIFEWILEQFKIENSIKRYTEMPFHPGRTACCDYAKLGELHPAVLLEYDISVPVYIIELDIEKFFAQSPTGVAYSPIANFPASVRDLSLVCENSIESGLIVEVIEKSGGRYLESVEFFDVFELSDNQKSLSYKLTFRKSDGTLTDEEVDKAIKKILTKLEEKDIKLKGV